MVVDDRILVTCTVLRFPSTRNVMTSRQDLILHGLTRLIHAFFITASVAELVDGRGGDVVFVARYKASRMGKYVQKRCFRFSE